MVEGGDAGRGRRCWLRGEMDAEDGDGGEGERGWQRREMEAEG